MRQKQKRKRSRSAPASSSGGQGSRRGPRAARRGGAGAAQDAALAWRLQAEELRPNSLLASLSLQSRDFGPDDYEQLLALDEGNVKVGVKGPVTRCFRRCRGKSSDECPICLTPMRADRVQLRVCSHAFHEGCITNWLKDHHTCPIDKLQVD